MNLVYNYTNRLIKVYRIIHRNKVFNYNQFASIIKSELALTNHEIYIATLNLIECLLEIDFYLHSRISIESITRNIIEGIIIYNNKRISFPLEVETDGIIHTGEYVLENKKRAYNFHIYNFHTIVNLYFGGQL